LRLGNDLVTAEIGNSNASAATRRDASTWSEAQDASQILVLLLKGHTLASGNVSLKIKLVNTRQVAEMENSSQKRGDAWLETKPNILSQKARRNLSWKMNSSDA